MPEYECLRGYLGNITFHLSHHIPLLDGARQEKHAQLVTEICDEDDHDTGGAR